MYDPNKTQVLIRPSSIGEHMQNDIHANISRFMLGKENFTHVIASRYKCRLKT